MLRYTHNEILIMGQRIRNASGSVSDLLLETLRPIRSNNNSLDILRISSFEK